MTSTSKISFLALAVLIGFLLTCSALLLSQFAPAAAGPKLAMIPTLLPNQPSSVESPNIAFISNPTPACVLPHPGTGVCYVNWSYLYATSDPNYMITMTVAIDNRARARYQGFFQTSMYVPDEMLVFRVACGAPGSGGDPNWGLNHSFVIRARDSAGQNAANYGQVFCPSDQVKLYLPLLFK